MLNFGYYIIHNFPFQGEYLSTYGVFLSNLLPQNICFASEPVADPIHPPSVINRSPLTILWKRKRHPFANGRRMGLRAVRATKNTI